MKNKDKKSILLTGDFFKTTYSGRFNNQIAMNILSNNTYNLYIKNEDENDNSDILNNINEMPPFVNYNIYSIYNIYSAPFYKDSYSIILGLWMYNTIPENWKEPLKNIDRMWVPSEYSKNCMSNFIPSKRISVIPPGIDGNIFNNTGESYKIPSSKKVKFLFTGDISWYSGFDLLFKAYTEEFSPEEDVTLVILKHHMLQENYFIKTDFVQDKYTNMNLQKIFTYQSLPDTPEIVYLQDYLNIDQLAGLYRASSCLVYTFRTESLLLPVLESMFSGTPVITTKFGPATEVCNDSNCYILEPRLIKGTNQALNNQNMMTEPVFAEVDIMDLRKTMRNIYNNYTQAQEKAKTAYAEVRKKYSIDNTIKFILKELKSIPKTPIIKQLNHSILFEGFNALEENKFDRAEEIFNNVLEYSPNDSSANLGVGSVYLNAGQYDKALYHLAISIKTNPSRIESYSLMAFTLFALNETELAYLFFKKLAELTPNDPLFAERAEAVNKLINPDLPKSKYDYLRELVEENKSPTVSLCIITRDEESHLEDCLESAKDFFNEIILIDTGSKDNTLKIAREHNAQIHNFKWTGSFSDARNQFFKYAKSDWIFYMDADEYMDEKTGELLKKIISCPEKNEELIKCYDFRIYNYLVENDKNSVTVSYSPRLFPNKPQLKFTGNICEKLICEDKKYRMEKVPVNDSVIFHYGYIYKSKEKHIKRKQYIKTLEKLIQSDPENCCYMGLLGILNYSEGNVEKAIEILKSTIKLLNESKNNDNYTIYIYLALAAILNNEELYKESIELFQNASKEMQNIPDYSLDVGRSYLLSDNDDKALELLNNSVSMHYKNIGPGYYTNLIFLFKAFVLIGEIHIRKEELTKAEKYLNYALKAEPNTHNLRLILARINIKLNKYRQAEAHYIDLILKNQFQDVARKELEIIRKEVSSAFMRGLI